jgi:hypothetical protein
VQVAVHGRRLALLEVLEERSARRPRLRLVQGGRGHGEGLVQVEAHRGRAVALHRVLQPRGAQIPVLPTLSRERERATFPAAARLWLTARCSRFPSAAHRNLERGGYDVRRVRVVQDLLLAQLPGRARGQGLQEVLGPGLPHEQKEEQVSVRVLYFLLPRFPRSRRSFDDAPFSPDAALPTRNAFDAIDAIDTIAGSE